MDGYPRLEVLRVITVFLCVEVYITSYEPQGDDDLFIRSINQILCESCCLSGHYNKIYCLMNPEELQELREQVSDMALTIINR